MRGLSTHPGGSWGPAPAAAGAGGVQGLGVQGWGKGVQGLISSQVGDLGRWRRRWAGPGPALVAGPSCTESARLGEWEKRTLKEILQP